MGMPFFLLGWWVSTRLIGINLGSIEAGFGRAFIMVTFSKPWCQIPLVLSYIWYGDQSEKDICRYISALDFLVYLFPILGFFPFFHPPYVTNCNCSLPSVCGLGGRGTFAHGWSLMSMFVGSYVPGSLW